MIIGITGFNGAGKSTIAKYLEEKGFLYLSMNTILSEECKKRGLSNDRDNLITVANELREKLGPAALVKIAKESFEPNKDIVIESLRNPEEVKELKSYDKFYLIGVNADINKRFERIKLRKRDLESMSFKKFVENERRELTNTTLNAQLLLDTYKLKDFEIVNDFDLNNLYERVELILSIITSIKDPYDRFDKSYVSVYKFDKKVILRPFKDKYYLSIAREVAKRSTCLNVRYGAIIVKDDQIISTGYVGAPRDVLSSLDKGFCLRRQLNIPSGSNYEICRSVHAEQNAIINAARAGVSLLGSKMYFFGERYNSDGSLSLVTGYPCFICKKMIINAGIKNFISITEKGEIAYYDVNEWKENWRKKDMLEDNVKYSVKY
ncbi:MAG: dCMP deaminase [Candidatus Woesearchaeota archaeon]|nr:dCMP deaminase [Candidatus Woesearchaeota archaeon]MDN5327536.1 dCMP deaminase [Candidatus Woesearchaeota archaeon]